MKILKKNLIGLLQVYIPNYKMNTMTDDQHQQLSNDCKKQMLELIDELTPKKPTIIFKKKQKPTIKVNAYFNLYDCDRKCESSPKIGTSWWKQFGYNSACLCLEDKVKLEYREPDSNTDYSFVLAHHSDDDDDDEDLDICGETGREFDIKNPVIGCGKTITDDDENIMIGNISFCACCGENGMDDDDIYEYDCGCPANATISYLMTKDDEEAYICQDCYYSSNNNRGEFKNWVSTCPILTQ